MPNRSSADDRGGTSSGIVRVPLRSPAAKGALLVAGLLLVGLYVGLALRAYRASRLSASLDAPSLLRAIALEPGNAAHHWALGRVRYFSEQDFYTAVADYQRATSLHPHVARYWLDLAAAQQVLGQTAAQRHSLERALKADSTTPDLLREAANYYLALGDHEEALRLFGLVVRHDPAAAPACIELCWRATRDVDAVATAVLPSSADAYLTFLNTLVEHRETEAALRLWPRLVALQQEIKPQSAFRFIQFLIEQHEVGPAYQAWNDIARMTRTFSAYLADDNRVVNGGFEQEVLNGGFGWRYQSSPAAELAIDTTVRHDGQRSLAITFKGEPTADAGIFQYVPVEPGASYRLVAETRTQDLEGASAPRFGARDAYTGAWCLQSDEIQPSSAWRTQIADLTTGPETRLVELRIIRSPGDTRIRGRMWVDDIRLVKR